MVSLVPLDTIADQYVGELGKSFDFPGEAAWSLGRICSSAYDLGLPFELQLKHMRHAAEIVARTDNPLENLHAFSRLYTQAAGDPHSSLSRWARSFEDPMQQAAAAPYRAAPQYIK